MAKFIHTVSKTTELLVLSSVAVIVVAALIIIQHGGFTAKPVEAQVEGARTVRMDTPLDMMNVLKATVDDGGESDFRQLKIDASGL